MSKFDEVIFGKTTFSDILKEIHKKSNDKDKQIIDLINQLKDLIHNIQDATLIVPLIKMYVDLSIQNNEQIVKMAAIVQKALDRAQDKTGSDVLFTEEEKAQLREAAKELGYVDTKVTKKDLA